MDVPRDSRVWPADGVNQGGKMQPCPQTGLASSSDIQVSSLGDQRSCCFQQAALLMSQACLAPGAVSLRFLVSLCTCHCPWTPKAPRWSQGKPEGDEVTSGLGLWESGSSWRQWGAGLVPKFWKDPLWVRISPTLPPTVVCQRGDGVARPGLPTRRPPAPDGKARDSFTQRGRCCAREEEGRVGDRDGDRWGCLEGGSQDPPSLGACPKPLLL